MESNNLSKILIFIDWYVPGYKAGGPIRSIKNLVENFKQELQFYIITRNTDYLSKEPYANIPSNCWFTLEPNVQVCYCSADFLGYGNLKKLIGEQKWDVIYINGLFSWYFSILPLFFLHGKGLNIVVAPRGMLAEGALTLKKRKKKSFLTLGKKLGLYHNICFHATHAGEASEIRKEIFPNARIQVLPNLPAHVSPLAWQQRNKCQGFLKMVSIARISPEKNTKYALQVLKNLLPNTHVEFHLFGPIYDQAYWHECLAIIDQLPSSIFVSYQGSLPNEQVAKKLQEYHVLFMPSRGENYGHIIVESFTSSTPVIISDKTPWKRLQDYKAGWDLPLSDQQEYGKVIQLLVNMDQDEYDVWSQGAFCYSQEKIKDSTLILEYKRLFGIDR